jgi:hypothetical protein
MKEGTGEPLASCSPQTLVETNKQTNKQAAKERIMDISAIVLTVFLICPAIDVEQKAFTNCVISHYTL